MANGNIYVGVKGLVIDVPMTDGNGVAVPYTSVSLCRLDVIPPGKTIEDEESWPATAVEPNIIRHVVPDTAVIIAGKYRIQPYIETLDGFKGHIDPVEIEVYARYRK